MKHNDIVSPTRFLFDPSLTARDSEQVCIHCKSLVYLCHEKLYSNYCYQATYSYLQDKENGLLAVFSPARLESVFMSAYNEIRRSDMWMRFGYYTPGWLRVPKCMELNSMKTASDLGYYPSLCGKLEKDREEGRKQYFQAQRDRKS